MRSIKRFVSSTAFGVATALRRADVASVSWTAKALRSATDARDREQERNRKRDRERDRDQNVGVIGSGGGSSSSDDDNSPRLTSNHQLPVDMGKKRWHCTLSRHGRLLGRGTALRAGRSPWAGLGFFHPCCFRQYRQIVLVLGSIAIKKH
ncbi:hypothetical protein F5Y07DRAFT_384328 [Xylaria sp. FL0933]|nr:hypothetical protein F5Y07DRAFT_384328 [Xylaria sp. FL0933]